MTSTDTDTSSAPQAIDPIAILVKKAEKDILVDFYNMPMSSKLKVVVAGLNSILNLRQSKELTPTALKELEEHGKTAEANEARASAYAKAEEILSELMSGNLKTRGTKTAKSKADKIPREVKSEAMRIARNKVRDVISASGARISWYKLSEISEYARQMIEDDPSILAEAQAAYEHRKATPIAAEKATEIMSKIKTDPKLIKAAEDKKVTKRKPKDSRPDVSALLKGGAVPPRRRAEGQPTA